MIEQLGPPVVAFLIGSLVACLELITSKYPQTFFLLGKCWAFYIYALIYGGIGFAVMLLLNLLISAGTIKLEGLGLSSPWVQAIALGLTIKGLLHIRLFSVTVGSQPFPVGIETIVQIFEPWLLRTIELDHFNSIRGFINPRALRYSDLSEVRNRIRGGVPKTFSHAETAAFLADVDRVATVVEAMELYLGFLGLNNFNRVFPL